jgi:predicted nucleic acid-binding protein
MRKPEKTFYWDTCIFVAILNGEDRAPGEMEGAKAVATAVDRGDAGLLTSVLTRTEILDGKIPEHALDLLDNLFKKPNLQRADVTQSISDAAHDIRNNLHLAGRKMQVPDAIHLATALIYRVDELHTFDGELLDLDGHPLTNGVRIVKPSTRQGELLL